MEAIDLEKIKQDGKIYYKGLDTIVCPALNEKVVFDYTGLKHIVFKSSRHLRDKNSQYMRFKLLPLAVKLIRLTTTYQEYERTVRKMTVKHNGVDMARNKEVKYWGLIAIIEDRKIKVILRKIGNGHLHFWSIIPSWTTNKTRDGKLFSTMKGNPYID